jgi:hypothetical protein
MKGWYVSDELERMSKEAVVVYFKVLFVYLPGGTEEQHKNPDQVAGLRAEIWTRDLPNTNHSITTFDEVM